MGLFSSKTKVKTLAQPWQIQGQAELATQAKPPAYQRIQRAGQPYPGQLVAPMSAQEETSLSQLSRFQGDTAMGGENPLYAAAEQEYLKTLGGQEYDPVAGEYYQAYRNAVMREIANATNALAARTSASDAFFGGGRLDQERQLQEAGVNMLAQELGRLYENERQRRMTAATQAPALAQARQGAALTQIEAGQVYGALPRAIEQLRADAEYMEWQLTWGSDSMSIPGC